MHYHGRTTDPEDLFACDADNADVILVLAEQAEDNRSDVQTFDILHRLRDMNCRATILAECVEDCNRERLKAAGADVVVRPIRFYPEITVQAAVTPGTESILENLFTHAGDECVGYKIQIKSKRWSEIVSVCLENRFGTAIAFTESATGEVVCNPGPDMEVNASSLFVISKEGRTVDKRDIERLLAEISTSRAA